MCSNKVCSLNELKGIQPKILILGEDVWNRGPQVVPPFVCLADIDWLYSVRTCEGVHPEQDYRDGDGGHSEDDQE